MRRTIIAIIILLAASAGVKAQESPVVDKIVAVVGKNIVKMSDIENNYAAIRVRQGNDKAHENRCSILENMLVSKLLLHKGQVDSTEVTDEEVETNLQYYLDAYEMQYGGREGMRKATGYTYDEFKELLGKMLRERMIIERVQRELTSNVKVTPSQVTEYYNKIPEDSVPTLEATYEIAEIVRKPAISEEERDRVKLELNKMRERVLNGESFTMLATLYSEDPGSARKGGELGFFTRGKMVAEFEAAAFALKPGEVSPVIESPMGFHIIQYIERRGNTINVRHILMAPKVSPEDMLRNRILLDSVAQEIRLGHLTFAEAAQKYSDNSNSQQGGTVSHPQNGGYKFTKDELRQLYPGVSFTTMNAGDISNAMAIKTEDNKDAYRIVTLVRSTPEHKANLVDDYDRIYNAALEMEKENKVFDWASKIIKNTYIRIDDEYKDCNFRLDWLKTK
ncbi:MAG: peptidylprolyl isomerase [Bacteroidales bacterium]|nr:peptidylprolyl isomerase [Bacteroidales bacterium]